MSGLNSCWGYFKQSSLSRVTSAGQREAVASLQLLLLQCVDRHPVCGKLVQLAGQAGETVTCHCHYCTQAKAELLAGLLDFFFFLIPGRFHFKCQ